MALRATSQSGLGYHRWDFDPLAVDGSHERALALLLVLLLAGMVGGAFASILILLHLAFEAVENCPDCVLARGVAGGDVKKLLGGSQALTS